MSRSFFECGPEIEAVAQAGPDEIPAGTDPEDTPALRDLGRPSCWSAPNSPETVLAGLYASAARRATDVLNRS